MSWLLQYNRFLHPHCTVQIGKSIHFSCLACVWLILNWPYTDRFRPISISLWLTYWTEVDHLINFCWWDVLENILNQRLQPIGSRRWSVYSDSRRWDSSIHFLSCGWRNLWAFYSAREQLCYQCWKYARKIVCGLPDSTSISVCMLWVQSISIFLFFIDRIGKDQTSIRFLLLSVSLTICTSDYYH